MKKTILTFLASLLFASLSFGQSSSDVQHAETWTWFGIDYTQCYFLTPMDFPSVSDLESKIKAWNDLVLYERAKFLDKNLLGRNTIFYLDAVENRNKEIDVRSRITDDGFLSSHMESTQIQDIINSYDIPEDMEGIGLVLIAESYSKPNVKGSYYVTFFDITTKKVLITERMLGKPSGFGLRNYWAGSYNNVLKAIGKKYK